MCLMPQVFSLDSRHMLYSRGSTNRYSSAQHDLTYSCGLSGRTKVMDFNETTLQILNFNLGGLVM